MEIESIVGDGMYTFAIVANANVRRRYRVRRSTGAIQVFTDNGSHWRRPSLSTADGVRLAIAAVIAGHFIEPYSARRVGAAKPSHVHEVGVGRVS
jgi:hypothetical protein